jgi:hypothetical protein
VQKKRPNDPLLKKIIRRRLRAKVSCSVCLR